MRVSNRPTKRMNHKSLGRDERLNHARTVLDKPQLAKVMGIQMDRVEAMRVIRIYQQA